MIPLYVAGVGLAAGDVIFLDRALSWGNRAARGLMGSLGLLLLVALPAILPVPVLPRPSGPAPIGTITAQITDRTREEIYGPSPGGPREFMVQVWYPAKAAADDDPVPWSEDWDVVAPALSRNLGLPSWFLNHTRYTSSHAVRSLPIADGTFPVVIYSHGWTGFRTIAINQMEHLASNGYIVIAPDHTYGAVATRLDDGEVIEFDPAALPDASQPGGESARIAAGTDLVATYSGDLVRILDELDKGQSGVLGAVAPSADLNRVGIYGHSTGGGAAIQTCLEDERCKAVLGMDPWVEPLPRDVLRLEMTRPALYMRSEEWQGDSNDALLSGIAARSQEISYVIGVEGAEHNDFVATPFLSPFASQMGLRGSIPAGQMIMIIDNYLLGFFDVYLVGTGSAALDSVSFPEVSVQVVTP